MNATAAQMTINELNGWTGPARLGASSRHEQETVRRACHLIAEHRPRAADELVTLALIGHPGGAALWITAALARLKRGRWRSAAMALQMGAWLTGDPELLELARRFSSELAGDRPRARRRS